MWRGAEDICNLHLDSLLQLSKFIFAMNSAVSGTPSR